MRLPWRLATSSVLLASPAVAANLNVVVTGIRNDRGMIAVAICDKANFPSGVCPYRTRVPAKTGTVTVQLSGVATGTWAAAVYHDEAGIGRLEIGLFGAPKQGFGFSRDAKMRFGPPSFADAAFALGDGGSVVTVPLHYPP